MDYMFDYSFEPYYQNETDANRVFFFEHSIQEGCKENLMWHDFNEKIYPKSMRLTDDGLLNFSRYPSADCWKIFSLFQAYFVCDYAAYLHEENKTKSKEITKKFEVYFETISVVRLMTAIISFLDYELNQYEHKVEMEGINRIINQYDYFVENRFGMDSSLRINAVWEHNVDMQYYKKSVRRICTLMRTGMSDVLKSALVYKYSLHGVYNKSLINCCDETYKRFKNRIGGCFALCELNGHQFRFTFSGIDNETQRPKREKMICDVKRYISGSWNLKGAKYQPSCDKIEYPVIEENGTVSLVTFGDYNNYIAQGGKQFNRMFTCCERKLLPCHKNKRNIRIVVAFKPCKMCTRLLEKRNLTSTVVSISSKTGNEPDMAKADRIGRLILQEKRKK